MVRSIQEPEDTTSSSLMKQYTTSYPFRVSQIAPLALPSTGDRGAGGIIPGGATLYFDVGK